MDARGDWLMWCAASAEEREETTKQMVAKMTSHLKKGSDIWLPEVPTNVRSEYLSIVWAAVSGVEAISDAAIEVGNKCLSGGRAPHKGDLQHVQRYLQEISILLLVHKGNPPSLPLVPAIFSSLVAGCVDQSSPLITLQGEGTISDRIMSGEIKRKQIINTLEFLNDHGISSLTNNEIPNTEVPMYRDVERD
eukprot:TRINITY_DN10933_c0_g1_i1.p1 TRINITY_DN10933_c0_g1~~TRINITY_DN10933_c0_g1_i1.p1  ORF type:complete len:192 (+),score=15.01 TRINITY_DN10933_c0_g1_i1:114-689(+)